MIPVENASLHATVDELLDEAATHAMRGRFIDAETQKAQGLYVTARLLAPPSAAREWPTFWQWCGMLWAAALHVNRYGAR